MNFELPVLAPSILAADFTRLGEEIDTCANEGVQWIHCDIMDGHFVPNISYGPGIVGAVRDHNPELFLDVHLMIEEPDRYIDDFADAGSDLISVHVEACPHLHRTLQNIRQNGCLTGVAINPATPVQLLEPVLGEVDLVLVMSVNPGFGGQKFIEQTFQKIQALGTLRTERNHHFLIEVDGGVGTSNATKLVSVGTDILVAGSSVFKADDIPERIRELNKLASAGSGKIA
jgi:ribulose-phosphate 3-epimerase